MISPQQYTKIRISFDEILSRCDTLLEDHASDGMDKWSDAICRLAEAGRVVKMAENCTEPEELGDALTELRQQLMETAAICVAWVSTL